jgi:predicted metal-dependent hydrolase
MDAAPEYDARYLAGIDHFNRGDYFDAHEVWEDLWHNCVPSDRLFYQSLIQAAVALYHWGNSNRSGASRLYASGLEKMSGYRPIHHGLDVADFWRQVEAALAGIWVDSPKSPAPNPQIVLTVREPDHD